MNNPNQLYQDSQLQRATFFSLGITALLVLFGASILAWEYGWIPAKQARFISEQESPTETLISQNQLSADKTAIEFASPQDGEIAVVQWIQDTPYIGGEEYYVHHDIYLLDIDDFSLEKVIDNESGQRIKDLSWSPNGQWLGWVRSRKNDIENDFEYVDSQRLTRSNVVSIRGEDRGRIAMHAWSPDGTKVALLKYYPFRQPLTSEVIIFDLLNGETINRVEILTNYIPGRGGPGYVDWLDNETVLTFTTDGRDTQLVSFNINEGLSNKKEIDRVSNRVLALDQDKARAVYYETRYNPNRSVDEIDFLIADIDSTQSDKFAEIESKVVLGEGRFHILNPHFIASNMFAFTEVGGDGTKLYVVDVENKAYVLERENIYNFDANPTGQLLIAETISGRKGSNSIMVLRLDGSIIKEVHAPFGNLFTGVAWFPKLPPDVKALEVRPLEEVATVETTKWKEYAFEKITDDFSSIDFMNRRLVGFRDDGQRDIIISSVQDFMSWEKFSGEAGFYPVKVSFLPYSSKIFFVKHRSGSAHSAGMFILDVNTLAVSALPNVGKIYENYYNYLSVISPDGFRIASFGYDKLYLLTLFEDRAEILVEIPGEVFYMVNEQPGPTWLNNKTIQYIVHPEGFPEKIELRQISITGE